MATVRYNGSALKIRGTDTTTIPYAEVVEAPAGGSVGTNIVTTKDVSQSVKTTTAAGANNFRLIPRTQAGGALPPETNKFVSNTPGVCSVDPSGNVSRVTNGTCQISFCTPEGASKYSRFMSAQTVTETSFSNYVTGSLGAHVRAAILGMVAGKSPSATTQNVLSSTAGGHLAPDHIRNVNLFTGALPLHAISVYTESRGSNVFPVVLLSPDHLIAGHCGCSPGQKVVFKNSAGAYEVRTVVSQIKMNNGGDDYVGLLDAPITTITPMPLLPANWSTYIPSLLANNSLEVLNKGWAAGDKIRVLGSNAFGYSGKDWLILGKSQDPVLGAWSSPIIGGDSNGPVFIPVNGAPVLLHCMWTAAGGMHYGSFRTQIQAAMDSLSTAAGKGLRVLGAADLTGFGVFA